MAGVAIEDALELWAGSLREVKRRKKQGPVSVRDLLWELERMQLQSERFRNVNIEAIYDFEKPFLGPRTRKQGEAAHG